MSQQPNASIEAQFSDQRVELAVVLCTVVRPDKQQLTFKRIIALQDIKGAHKGLEILLSRKASDVQYIRLTDSIMLQRTGNGCLRSRSETGID